MTRALYDRIQRRHVTGSTEGGAEITTEPRRRGEKQNKTRPGAILLLHAAYSGTFSTSFISSVTSCLRGE